MLLAAFGGASTPPPAMAMPPVAGPPATTDAAPGDPAAGRDLACIPLAEVDNRTTPAELYPAVAKCLEADRFDAAVELFAIAGAFGDFDRRRVADRAARQHLKALITRHIGPFDVEKRLRLRSEVVGVTAKGSPRREPLCTAIDSIGPPVYHPAYLVGGDEGARSAGGGKAALVQPFDDKAAWRRVLTDYLRCP